jgi:hypothetical protein
MKHVKLISACGLAATIALAATWAPRAWAAAKASDAACNDNGSNGSNGGTGFGAWSTAIAVGGGTYTTTDNTISNASCATAWGTFTGTNTTTATSQARPFTSANSANALQPGQQVSVMMHNGGIATGGSEGVSLWNTSSNGVLELVFDGGSSTWSINDSTGFHAASPSIPYAGGSVSGLLAVVRLTSSTTYSLTVTEPANRASGVQTVYGPYAGTLANPSGGQAITQLRFFTFDDGSGNNLQFNNLNVSCPDTLLFTTQPVSETVPTNDAALFSANTFGDSVTYQWQSSPDGSSWTSIASGTNGYTVNATNYESFLSVAAQTNNFQYRSIATDACGNTATSSVATLTLTATAAPGITTQPANTATCSNSPATFTVTAPGSSPGYAWLQSSNAGWGAGSAWSVIASNAGSGVFIGSSTNNDSGTPVCTGFGGNDINSPAPDRALGMFGPVIKVLRQFPSSLSAGQWFSIDMDNGNVDTGAQNGFSLHTSSGAGDQVLFSFYFLGGARNYKISDGTGEQDTGIRFTRTGLRIQMLMGPGVGGTNTYTLFFQTNQCGAATAITNTFSGLFKTNGPAGAVLLFNNDGAGGSANDMYFNNIIAGAAYDNASNYSVGNWVGSNNGDLPITGATNSSYTINNAQSSGTYYVIVTNAAGAVVSSTATLTVNPNPNLSLSKTDVSCNGGTNGSIQATFSGGTGALQVNIDGGAYGAQTSPYTFTGLSAGSHTVSVQDTKGCASNLTITVNQPSAVTISSTSKQDNTVCGGTAGSITVTASGGTGALQYSDNGGATYQETNEFTGLASGAYSIVVRDANGCTTAATPVTISDPNGPSFTFTQVNETCNGQSVGSITVTASGGSGSGYTYSKDNGATFQGGNQFTGLAAGIYTVVVKDGNGCNSGGQVVTITQPSAVTFTTSQVNEICNGQSVGSITVTASGGSGSGYTYSMDNGSTFQAGNQFTGLSAGTYQIVVKDGSGCLSGATPVIITQPALLSCSVSPSIVTNCAGSSQIFTVSVSGGTAGYAYGWTGPNSFSANGSSVTNNDLQPANAGTYTVTVTDANSCQSTCTATLTVNVAPSITGQPTDTAVCAGSATNLTVTASGSPLNYVWRKLGSGWGGGGWTFTNSGAASSEFIGSSTDNDSGDTAANGGNDINTGGKTWALFNNGGVADAKRAIPGGLQIGQTFSIDMDNGNVQTGGTIGFGLQNTANSNNRLEVFFVGGSNDYTVSDNAGSNDSGIGFTRTGIHCQITLTSTDTYSITIIRYAGSVTATTNTLTGTLKGTAGTAIDLLRLFNASAGDCGFGCNAYTLYFNNISFGCNDDNAGNYTTWTAGSDLGQGPLANGGDVSGAATATLTINPASTNDAGSYDVFVTNSCGGAISSNATVTVNSLPAQYGVGGGGADCSGGSGVSVTLSNSDIGVNYQLELANSPAGSPIAGTGSALTFSNQTAGGTYTVIASNITTACTAAMNGSATVTINTYTITASAGANGSISPSGAVSVNCGTDQGFTITPNTGYHIADVLVDSVSVGPVSSYSFTGVMAPHTISASFAIDTFTITASAGSNGTITPSGAVNVNYGSDQTFNITPVDSCHQIAEVLVDSVSVGAVSSYTFTNVTANHTIDASFAIINYTITASAGTNGSISPSGPVSVSCGTNQDFTITANPGYPIVDVLVDGNSVGPVSGYTFTNVTADHTIDASFATNLFQIISITREGADIRLTWTTAGGHDYMVQTNAPPLDGSYTNNFNFSDLATISVPGIGESTTNYLDVGGVTNAVPISPSRYYRIRLGQ